MFPVYVCHEQIDSSQGIKQSKGFDIFVISTNIDLIKFISDLLSSEGHQVRAGKTALSSHQHHLQELPHPLGISLTTLQ